MKHYQSFVFFFFCFWTLTAAIKQDHKFPKASTLESAHMILTGDLCSIRGYHPMITKKACCFIKTHSLPSVFTETGLRAIVACPPSVTGLNSHTLLWTCFTGEGPSQMSSGTRMNSRLIMSQICTEAFQGRCTFGTV